MNPTENTPEINLEINNSSNLNTRNIFVEEEKLIDSITNKELQDEAREEFNEMIDKYKSKEEEIRKGSNSLLDELKLEFKEDIQGLEKIDTLEFLKSFENYDLFIDLISKEEDEGGIKEELKEKLYEAFNNGDEMEIEMFLDMELMQSNPVDEISIQDFIDKFGTNSTEKEYNKIYGEGGKINNLNNEIKEEFGENNNEIKEEKLSDKYLKELENENKKLKNNLSEEETKKNLNNTKAFKNSIKVFENNDFIKERIDKIDDFIKKEDKDIKKEDKDNVIKNITEIGNYLLSEEGLKLLKELKDKSPEKYNNLISIISEFDNNFENKLNIALKESKEKLTPIPKSNIIETKVGDGDFSLEVNIPFPAKNLEKPITNMSFKERAEFSREKIRLKGEIKEFKGHIETYKNHLSKVDEKMNEFKTQLDELKKKDNLTDKEKETKLDLEQKIEQGKNIKKQYENQIQVKQSLIEVKEKELENLISDFNSEMDKRYKDKLKKYREKEKLTKDNYEFLKRTGFNVFGNTNIDPVINHINKYKGSIDLGGTTLQGDINFSEGIYGEGPNDGIDKGREMFIKLFNKMISGNIDEPIKDITGVIRGTNNLFKDKITVIKTLEKYDINPNTIGISSKLIENLGNKKTQD